MTSMEKAINYHPCWHVHALWNISICNSLWGLWCFPFLEFVYASHLLLSVSISLEYSANPPIHQCIHPSTDVKPTSLNPFTPESDQCQNSPAALQEIWHHTLWRTRLFVAYLDEKWLYYKSSLHHSYNRLLKGWENTLFELRSGRVNLQTFLKPKCETCYFGV